MDHSKWTKHPISQPRIFCWSCGLPVFWTFSSSFGSHWAQPCGLRLLKFLHSTVRLPQPWALVLTLVWVILGLLKDTICKILNLVPHLYPTAHSWCFTTVLSDWIAGPDTQLRLSIHGTSLPPSSVQLHSDLFVFWATEKSCCICVVPELGRKMAWCGIPRNMHWTCLIVLSQQKSQSFLDGISKEESLGPSFFPICLCLSTYCVSPYAKHCLCIIMFFLE